MQGRFNKACTYNLHALQGRERKGSLDPGHLETTRTGEGFGEVAEDQQKYDDAEKWYRGVLEASKPRCRKDAPKSCAL